MTGFKFAPHSPRRRRRVGVGVELLQHVHPEGDRRDGEDDRDRQGHEEVHDDGDREACLALRRHFGNMFSQCALPGNTPKWKQLYLGH